MKSASQFRRSLRRFFFGTLSPLPLLAILLLASLCGYLGNKLGKPAEKENKRYDSQIRNVSEKYFSKNWDWRILKAMIRQESNFNPQARSQAGALGLCQMMPKTAKSLGVSPRSLRKPQVSIESGALYLHKLWMRWEHLPDRPPEWTRSRFAIASYNAGISRVRKTSKKLGNPTSWKAIAPHLPKETRQHIKHIFDEYLPQYQKQHRSRPARGVRARPRRWRKEI